VRPEAAAHTADRMRRLERAVRDGEPDAHRALFELAVRTGDTPASALLMRQLLKRWRRHSFPALAETIEHVGVRLVSHRGAALRASVRGVRTMDDTLWLALAGTDDPLARPALLDTLTYATQSEMRQRVSAMADWPRDPRTTTALLALIERLPMRAMSTRRLWREIVDIVIALRDPRVPAALEKLDARLAPRQHRIRIVRDVRGELWRAREAYERAEWVGSGQPHIPSSIEAIIDALFEGDSPPAAWPSSSAGAGERVREKNASWGQVTCTTRALELRDWPGGDVQAISASSSGDALAIVGQGRTHLFRRSGEVFECRRVLRESERVAVSADGAWLATARRSVYLADIAMGGRRVLGRHDVLVDHLAWAPDGSFFASGDAVGALRVWATTRVAPPLVLASATDDAIEALAVDPRGEHVAALSRMGVLSIYRARDGRSIARVALAPDRECARLRGRGGGLIWTTHLGLLAYTPGGVYRVTAEADDSEQAFLCTTRHLLSAERLGGEVAAAAALEPTPAERRDPAGMAVGLAVVFATRDGTLTAWHPEAGTTFLCELERAPRALAGHSRGLYIALEPDAEGSSVAPLLRVSIEE